MPNYKRLFIESSYLFITIVTHQRRPILIDNIDILRKAFENTKKIYNFEIYCAVVLPDHLHVILVPKNIKEYPKIIHSVKYYFSRNLTDDGGMVIPPYIEASKLKKGDKGIWQRRYFEHTIRDEKDLYNHLDYIHYNPVKHEYANNVKDWAFSSFDKFVKSENYDIDWGSSEDLKIIKTLEYD